MCLRAGLLIGWDDQSARALVARADCDSWKCAECAKKMKDYWLLRAELGAREIIRNYDFLDFITLTSHEKNRTFASSEKVWRSAWAKLYAALERRRTDFAYMIIPEQHDDGTLHFHGLWNGGKAERWLKDNARKRGLGYMVDVSHVIQPREAVGYVTKYIGKDLGEAVPSHFRRVRVSRQWIDIPKPLTAYAHLTWQYVGTNGELLAVYERCQSEHKDLIDVSTGEIFDDVDLGTTIYA
jgi:hypothetical protein